MKEVQVLIVGAGIAGLSAALWCKRLGLTAAVVERESDIGGQLRHIHNEIWDFLPRVYDNGAQLLAEMKQNKHVAQLDIRLGESLLAIDPVQRRVETDRNQYRTEYLILATGVRPNGLPQLADSPLLLSPWFSTSVDGPELAGKRVLVIGGGDRAVESACNLASHASHVWIAVRGGRLRARPEWSTRLSSCSNVTVMYHTEATSVQHEPTGAVWLRRQEAAEPVLLEVDAILPRIGVRGNSDEAAHLERDANGFFRVDSNLVTSAGWIYAIGDVANGPAYASLSLAAGQGMKAAKHISLRVREG